MYCALPSSLQSMIELSDEGGGGEEFVFGALADFLKALCVLEVPARRLTALRRHLQLLTSVREEANEGALNLESLLRQHDLLLGPELGGFANLFKSAVDEELIFNGEFFDFDGLDSFTKTKLSPLQEVAKELIALDDVAPIIAGSVDTAAACILLSGVEAKCSRKGMQEWLSARPFLETTRSLYAHQARLENLSVDFVQHELRKDQVPDFALWLLARILAGTKTPGPLERRLIDTLFCRAGLATLATFERAR